MAAALDASDAFASLSAASASAAAAAIKEALEVVSTETGAGVEPFFPFFAGDEGALVDDEALADEEDEEEEDEEEDEDEDEVVVIAAGTGTGAGAARPIKCSSSLIGTEYNNASPIPNALTSFRKAKCQRVKSPGSPSGTTGSLPRAILVRSSTSIVIDIVDRRAALAIRYQVKAKRTKFNNK